VRQANLSQVLTLIHQHGALRRSDLTLMTGLNRSTILDLVANLQKHGLVTQTRTSGVGEIGRPSIEVAASDAIVSFVVIPRLGEITIGVVGLGGNVVMRQRQALPEGATPEFAAGLAGEVINQLKKTLGKGTRIAGIGVAAPGQVRVKIGNVRFAPSLGWRESSFAALLEAHTNLPVRLDNDASLACAAEQTFGAGAGFDNMVFLIGVPGGVGGGAVIKGELLRGHHGYAGELGHMRISDSEAQDYSGIPGTLEAMVVRDHLVTALGLSDADDEQLFEALRLRHNEPDISELLDRQVHYLGRAVALLLVALNPQLVVLSGFLEIHLELRKDQLLKEIQPQALPFALEGVEIRPGSMGSNLLPVGTAELGFQALLQNPLGFELAKA
jgi:predicted NBD/HSP70 family sugar kinase